MTELLLKFIKKHISKSKKKIREYKYYQKNKDKNREKKNLRHRQHYHNNKDSESQRKKVAYIKNKDSICERTNNYQKTPIGHKVKTKSQWKRMGLNMENFEDIYKKVMNTTHCDFCNVLLEIGKPSKYSRCMDHCHTTGEFRNVLCNICNIKRIC